MLHLQRFLQQENQINIMYNFYRPITTPPLQLFLTRVTFVKTLKRSCDIEILWTHPTSLANLHSATDAKWARCNNPATQINSLAASTDLSFTQERLFFGCSSSHNLCKYMGEITPTKQSNRSSLLLSLSLSVSPSHSLMVIWRDCSGWQSSLFVHWITRPAWIGVVFWKGG